MQYVSNCIPMKCWTFVCIQTWLSLRLGICTIFYWIQKTKEKVCLKLYKTAENRVRQGNFTPTSLQNRAWNSCFTRIFSNVGYPVRDACLLLQEMALVEPGGWWSEIFPAQRQVVTESPALSLLPAPLLHLPFNKHQHYYKLTHTHIPTLAVNHGFDGNQGLIGPVGSWATPLASLNIANWCVSHEPLLKLKTPQDPRSGLRNETMALYISYFVDYVLKFILIKSLIFR